MRFSPFLGSKAVVDPCNESEAMHAISAKQSDMAAGGELHSKNEGKK